MDGDGQAERIRDGKTKYRSGQDKGWVKPCERLRTDRNGKNWSPDHL